MKNSKQHLTDAFSQLQDAQSNLKHALYNAEKLNNKEFNELLKKIDELNETLASSKTYYNNNTSKLNQIIRKFPSNIVAKIHRYKIKPFFDGKNMQDAVIDDFKL